MKIFCIGWNYPKHNREMQRDERPAEPTLFMKPETALLRDNKPFYVPDFSHQLEHEVELVVRINRMARCIQSRFAPRYYTDVALGIDFTARDLQNRAKAIGGPWETAKAFDNSAVLSPFVPLAELGGNIQQLDFSLDKNGCRQQSGNTADMLFPVDYLVEYISGFFTFREGDLIYTGTPAGVSAVQPGDHLTGRLCGRVMFDFDVL